MQVFHQWTAQCLASPVIRDPGLVDSHTVHLNISAIAASVVEAADKASLPRATAAAQSGSTKAGSCEPGTANGASSSSHDDTVSVLVAPSPKGAKVAEEQEGMAHRGVLQRASFGMASQQHSGAHLVPVSENDVALQGANGISLAVGRASLDSAVMPRKSALKSGAKPRILLPAPIPDADVPSPARSSAGSGRLPLLMAPPYPLPPSAGKGQPPSPEGAALESPSAPRPVSDSNVPNTPRGAPPPSPRGVPLPSLHGSPFNLRGDASSSTPQATARSCATSSEASSLQASQASAASAQGMSQVKMSLPGRTSANNNRTSRPALKSGGSELHSALRKAAPETGSQDAPGGAAGAAAGTPDAGTPTGGPRRAKPSVRIVLPDPLERTSTDHLQTAETMAMAAVWHQPVQAHKLGSYRFKGSPEDIDMVYLQMDAHAGRSFPTEQPKGKGNRTRADAGVFQFCPDVAFPSLSRKYYARWRSTTGRGVPQTPRFGRDKHWGWGLASRSPSMSNHTDPLAAPGGGGLGAPGRDAGAPPHGVPVVLNGMLQRSKNLLRLMRSASKRSNYSDRTSAGTVGEAQLASRHDGDQEEGFEQQRPQRASAPGGVSGNRAGGRPPVTVSKEKSMTFGGTGSDHHSSRLGSRQFES